MATSSTTQPANACPEWCTLPRDHDPLEVATGSPRVHFSPVGGQELHLSLIDRGGWYAEVNHTEPYVGSREEVAAELRSLANALVQAAEWLEAQPA